MNGRRSFLRLACAAAVPLTSGLPRLALAGGTATSTAARPWAVLVQPAQPAAALLAQAFSRLAVPVLALDEGGDVTSVWQEVLAPAWQAGGASLAGLTPAPALFVLEQLAWSQGLRVAWHAEHLIDAQGGVRHDVLRAGPATAAQASARLARDPARWPLELARLMGATTRLPPGRSFAPTDAALAPQHGGTLLASWVLAPLA